MNHALCQTITMIDERLKPVNMKIQNAVLRSAFAHCDPHRVCSKKTVVMGDSCFAAHFHLLSFEITSDPNCRWNKYISRLNTLHHEYLTFTKCSSGDHQLLAASAMNQLELDIRADLEERSLKGFISRIDAFSREVLKKESSAILKVPKNNKKICQFKGELQLLTLGGSSKVQLRVNALKERLFDLKRTCDLRVQRIHDKMQSNQAIRWSLPLIPLSSSEAGYITPEGPSDSVIIWEINKKLGILFSQLDQTYFSDVLQELAMFQNPIYWEVSKNAMTICQRVYYHLGDGLLSADRLRRPIERTRMELFLVGFIEMVKEKGRNLAEQKYRKLFKTMKIWNHYSNYIKTHKNEQTRFSGAIRHVCNCLRKDWSILQVVSVPTFPFPRKQQVFSFPTIQ